jgi:hypothetical protein
MSSLRKPATDKLKRDYTALSALCQQQCRSDYRKKQGCVKDIIGEEETFRLNMEDEKYKKLVELLFAITQSEPHQHYLHF